MYLHIYSMNFSKLRKSRTFALLASIYTVTQQHCGSTALYWKIKLEENTFIDHPLAREIVAPSDTRVRVPFNSLATEPFQMDPKALGPNCTKLHVTPEVIQQNERHLFRLLSFSSQLHTVACQNKWSWHIV